jgi:asparagine synthase (glutamine-hydrolysing)
MLELDRRVWLPDDLLVKADKMTMAASVELRVPFLDHRLIEWCAGLPARLKLRGTVGKWLLRESARTRLPSCCTAPGKRGFTVPLSSWLRTTLHGDLRDALLSSDSVARTRFGEKAVRRLLDEHLLGRSDRKEELYSLWILDLWRRRFRVEVGESTRAHRPPTSRHAAAAAPPP